MGGGLLLVLSAPSGAGKTTLALRLLAGTADSVRAVSYTTRSPRGDEKDGIDYHYVARDEFRAMVDRGEFVEWAEVHGELYGSHNRYVDLASQGKVVLFVIDVQGGTTIKGRIPEAVLVFVLPPSWTELERRLRARKTDAETIVEHRLLAARNEVERGVATYDYLVVNDDVERALADLQAIVRAERRRRGRLAPPALGP